MITSCGSTKSTPSAQVAPNKSVSKNDFPFIDNFHQALRLKHQGKFDEAIKLLESCRTLRPNDDAVHFALYDLYLIKKQGVSAFEAITKAASLDPNNEWYTQELAYQNIERGNFAEAAKQLKKMTDRQPERLDWLFAYTEAQANAKNLPEAISALNKIQDRIGDNPDIYVQKYNLYRSFKQDDKAKLELETGLEKFPLDAQLTAMLVDHYFEKQQVDKAYTYLKKLAELDPTNGNAHMALAQYYESKGDIPNMISSLSSGFSSMDIPEETKVKIMESMIQSLGSRNQDLKKVNQVLIDTYPNSNKGYKLEGDIYLQQENFDLAIASYKKALAIDPNSSELWRKVTALEYQQRNYEELYKDSKAALELFPTVNRFYLYNGLSSINLRKYKDGIDVLNLGLELVGNDPIIKSEFLSQKGDAYFALKDNKNAQAMYEDALKLVPGNSLYITNYVYQLASSKVNLDRAEELAVDLLKKDPNQAKFIDNYGWVLFQRGKYDQALEHYTKAYKIRPSDPLIVEHLGDVYFKQGEVSKAVQYWNTAKELKSTNLNLNKKIDRKEYYDPIY